MDTSTVTTKRPPLRRDLTSLDRLGSRRPYRIVVDEISGRFARVSEHLWQSLLVGSADESTWRQADAAGWTRHRTGDAKPAFHPLSIRLSLGSIDGIAASLVPCTGWLFAPVAILLWSLLILLAMLLAIGRSGDIAASVGSLHQFLLQSNPLWLGLIFVATKVAHELAHAVMCRRVGSRCGSVGVLLLCGMPCPYCDVTDVWRQASTLKRVAVMLAGIYVELILATLATFVWLLATDPVLRLHALNLMVVCGVSTIVFNANPLMRYDGYYVLNDLLGSTNLRQEARDAFRSTVIKPIAGTGYGVPSRRDARAVSLAIYHGLSSCYRLLILSAIAALLMQVTGYFQIRQMAAVFLLLVVILMIARAVQQVAAVAGAKGNWTAVPRQRRLGIVMGIGLLSGLVLFVPLPRYRSASGWMDVADATNVYLNHDGMIEEVGFDFGQTVSAGDSLVNLKSDTLALEYVDLQGQLALASLRRELSRRSSLDRTELAQHWNTLKAAEEAVATRLAAVEQRMQQSQVKAPVGGVVLPPESSVSWQEPLSISLSRRVGTTASGSTSWCRISPTGSVQAVLVLNARDRRNIDRGSPVNISISSLTGKVVSSTIDSVSAIEQESETVTGQARYKVLCSIPAVGQRDVLSWIGQECLAVFRLAPRSIASDLAAWLQSWIDGELS